MFEKIDQEIECLKAEVGGFEEYETIQDAVQQSRSSLAKIKRLNTLLEKRVDANFLAKKIEIFERTGRPTEALQKELGDLLGKD